MRTMAHLTGEAMISVRDNALLSVAAISTVAVSLLVLAIVGLLALNLRNIARVLDAQVEIVAYLQSTETPAQEASLVARVSDLPGVTKVDLVTKSQGLAHLEQVFGGDASLFSMTQQNNPLPDSLNVSVAAPQDIAPLAAALQKEPGVAQIQNQQQVVNDLIGLTKALRIVGVVLVLALAVTTLVVIGNTVRVAVYARRDQIGIMKLVGATDSFIRWPFFIEGAILGLGGAIVAGAIVWWSYAWVHKLAHHATPFLPLLQPNRLMPHLGIALLAAGVVLGALGSAISVRRHLNV